MARIVWWIKINASYLASVGLAQDLQGVEVIALDVEVLRCVPVNALLGARAHGLVDGANRLGAGLLLAGPGELIALALVLGDVAHMGLERLDVDAVTDVAVLIQHLGHDVREQLRQLGGILGGDICRPQVYLIKGRVASSDPPPKCFSGFSMNDSS